MISDAENPRYEILMHPGKECREIFHTLPKIESQLELLSRKTNNRIFENQLKTFDSQSKSDINMWFRHIIFVILVTLLCSALGQIINPWTGRNRGIDKNKPLGNPSRGAGNRNRPARPQQAQDRADSEYLLSDGTPIYKFFKRNPYGK